MRSTASAGAPPPRGTIERSVTLAASVNGLKATAPILTSRCRLEDRAASSFALTMRGTAKKPTTAKSASAPANHTRIRRQRTAADQLRARSTTDDAAAVNEHGP